MLNFLKRHWFKILVSTILIFVAFWKGCEVTKHSYVEKPKPTKIDTIKAVFVPPVVIPNVPVKEKKVYKKKNKALRDSVEKKDIILDIKIVDNHIKETVIDTSGMVKELILDVPIELKDHTELVIVPEGVEAKEKTKAGKFLQKIAKKGKTVLMVIGGVTVIVLVAVLAGG